MKNIIQLTDTATAESENYSAVQAKKSSCEPQGQMLFSFGENFVMPALMSEQESRKQELIAQPSEMSHSTDQATLSDRLTPLLISAGLVCGITPTSIRRQLGARIPDFVLLSPDGKSAAPRKAD